MTYYRIVSPDNGENILMKRVSQHEIFHTSGAYIDEKSVKLPFKVAMHAGKESGYDQYDPDFEGEARLVPIHERLLDYYRLSALMSPALVDALRKVGVDNLQTFPVYIEDAFTGEPLNREYLLVNVIGLISCACLDASDHSPIGDTFYFHKLSIDENKAKGLLMFRLAESPFEIIVEEKVAQVINSGEFTGITAEPLS